MSRALDAFGSPKQILDARGLRPRLRFGQYFLVDPRVAQRIARALPANSYVIEIGGGTGTLTSSLAAHARMLDVLEVDRDLARVLRDRFAEQPERVRIVEGDALHFDFRAALAAQPRPRAICGNLPYSITTPLLEHILAASDFFDVAVVMVQREYGRRLVARPKTPDYGSLTLFAAHFCRCEKLFDIGSAGFYPRPKVDSVVVRLTPHPDRLAGVADEGLLLRLTRAAFAQRRKTLANSVRSRAKDKNGHQAPREMIEAALRLAGVSPAARGEDLDLEAFKRLANALNEVGGFSG